MRRPLPCLTLLNVLVLGKDEVAHVCKGAQLRAVLDATGRASFADQPLAFAAMALCYGREVPPARSRIGPVCRAPREEPNDRAPNRGALYGYANITLIDTGEKPIPPRSSGAWSGGREAPASMRLSRWLALVCAKLLTPRDQFAWGPIENGLQACSSLIASRSNSELNYFWQATQVHRQRLGIFPVPALDRHAVLELLTALGEPR